ncbi:MAG: hypothetical protein H0T78_11390 [Longispora sp.]|nr:hypothetical protein [Longispora sp. (in: high G+C Gram-positive bacteria)]
MGTTTTAAADLRSGLTYLLSEHVYRAGIALKTAVDKGGNLDGYRTSFGQLINSFVPEPPADAVANEPKSHTESVFATIDSLVANDGQVFAKLSAAADHMPMTAAPLASGIAANKKLS